MIPMRCLRLSWPILVLAMLVATIWLGCDTATEVDAPLFPEDTPGDDDDDDDTAPDTTPPDAPLVDPVTSPTGLTYQSVRGTAEPLATVAVSGGLADSETAADADGNFCVKVALKIGELNDLTFVAIDGAGNQSDPASTKIQQQIVNYALAGETGASSTSHSKPENTSAKAIDESYFTWWENTTQPWFDNALWAPQWFALKLADSIWIDDVRIYWGQDIVNKFEYATNFDLYVNTEEKPAVWPHEVPAEELADYGYVLVEHVEQPDDQNIESNFFDLANDPRPARWVFLALYESNQPGAWPGPNDEVLWSFEVAELEVRGFEAPDDGCE